MVETIRFYDACKQVVAKGSYVMVRDVEGGVAVNWDHVDVPSSLETGRVSFAPKKKAPRRQGWTIVDTFTASSFVQVFEALNAENQAKLNAYPFKKQIDILWKVIQKVR